MLCWVLHTHGTHRQPLGLAIPLSPLMTEPAVRIKPFVPGWFPFLHSFFAFFEKNSCYNGCEEEQDAGGRVTQTIQ